MEFSQFRELLQLSNMQKALLGCMQFPTADSHRRSKFKADHSTLDAKHMMRIVGMM